MSLSGSSLNDHANNYAFARDAVIQLLISIAQSRSLLDVNLSGNYLFGLEPTNKIAFSSAPLTGLLAFAMPIERARVLTLNLLENPLPSTAEPGFNAASLAIADALEIFKGSSYVKSLCGFSDLRLQTSVDYRNKRVCDLWVKVIAQEMAHNSQLISVNLSNNPFGDLGAAALAAVLVTSCHLRACLVENTKVSAAGYEAIEAAKKVAFGQRIGVLYLLRDRSRKYFCEGPSKIILEYLWGQSFAIDVYKKYI